MYLYKKTYIGNNWKDPKDQVKIDVPGIKQERVSEISERVAYWRKANAIHNWFVNNVQEGEDDCKEYWVSREQLEKLLKIVRKVLVNSKLVDGDVTNGYTYKDGKQIPNIEKGKYVEDPTVAKELLPNSEGFFFGSQEYDQWYIEDLEYTEQTLKALLKESDSADYYYQSSW